MARADRGAYNGRLHALFGAAAGFRFGARLHTEHAPRLGGRGQRRAGGQQPLLAPHRRELQVCVREADRPRRPFTPQPALPHSRGKRSR